MRRAGGRNKHAYDVSNGHAFEEFAQGVCAVGAVLPGVLKLGFKHAETHIEDGAGFVHRVRAAQILLNAHQVSDVFRRGGCTRDVIQAHRPSLDFGQPAICLVLQVVRPLV